MQRDAELSVCDVRREYQGWAAVIPGFRFVKGHRSSEQLYSTAPGCKFLLFSGMSELYEAVLYVGCGTDRSGEHCCSRSYLNRRNTRLLYHIPPGHFWGSDNSAKWHSGYKHAPMSMMNITFFLALLCEEEGRRR